MTTNVNHSVQHIPYPEKTEIVNQSVLEIDSGFMRFCAYPTPADILKFGLKGIPKRFPLTGEMLDEEYISPFLASAIADLEMTGLCINSILKTYNEDFHDQQFTKNYMPILLPLSPVLRVEKIVFHYPHTTTDQPMAVFIVPEHWITFEKNKVNIVASTGVLAPSLLNQTSTPVLAIWSNATYRPNAMSVTYQAGFMPDQLPYNLWKLLIDKAVYSILIDIGPLLLPVQSMSVGMDGISQSASTPGASLLDRRIQSLQKEIDRTTRKILGYYGINTKISFAGM
jgi:hypothetical protein